MRIKENKKQKFIKLKNKNYEDLGYESSICKESRFKPFFMDKMQTIDEFSMLLLSSAEKLRSPLKSIDVILVSVFLRISGMILSIWDKGLVFHQQILGNGERSDSVFQYQNHKYKQD